MDRVKILCMYIAILLAITQIMAESSSDVKSDLEGSASGRFLDLGSLLFNKYPSYGARPYYPSGYYPSSGYYPNSGGYYPNSGGYYPNSGGYNPSSGGYYPSSGGYYPSSGYPSYPSGGYYPNGGGYPGGTNFLGGGGGYGGYGGYGGNGGLSSYLGYYDRDYYGRRNVGFGYYPRTNNIGFIRSSNSLPEYVSGYRGYH